MTISITRAAMSLTLLTAGLTATADETTLSFISETPAITPVGQNFQVMGRVVNDTENEIEGFTLTLEVDGKEFTNEYPTRILVPGASADITWRTDYVPEQTGEFSYTLTLTGNGVEETRLAATAHVRVRRWVVEERTGTWCAACPMGIYMFEQLHEKMGDEFIGIALHTYGNDPMGVADYQLSAFTSNESAPYAMINRTRGCHPKDLEAELESMARRTLKASVEEASSVFDAETRTLTVNTEVMFDADYSNPSSDLRIGYFIIENDVHGDSHDYDQKNGFSGSATLPGWGSLPGTVSYQDMWYQEVGRGYSTDIAGVPGSVPSQVKAGETYGHTHSFTLPDNVSDVNNCRLVVMAIEARSNTVLNGIELPLDGSFSGLGSIYGNEEATPVYYNMNGMPVKTESPAPGLYIEVKAGKARKIIIR